MITDNIADRSASGQRFDIRNHIEKLQPSGKKRRYICPVCGGNNFTIDENNGAYQCWNGCKIVDIRNAIAPLGENAQRTRPPAKPKYKPAPIPVGVKLLTSDNLSDSPYVEVFGVGTSLPKAASKEAQRRYTYHYSDTQWVYRYEWDDSRKPKGYDKKFQPWHKEDGEEICKKGDRAWLAYRLAEAINYINHASSTPALLWVEGEKCVEIARASGIVSCTFNGSGWSEKEILVSLQQIKEADPLAVQVFLADSDDAGRKKAEKFQKCCNKLKLPCVVVNTSLFEVEGDIEQIFESMSVPEFIRRLEEEIHAAVTPVRTYGDTEDDNDDCKLAQKYNLIKAAWGDQLRWNSMKKRVEMHGSPLPLDRIKLRIAKELSIDISREDASEIILDLAQDNEYSPFKEYLEALPTGSPEFLNTLALRFLGTHDPLHQILLKRTLIAAVARTYQPGCKHDTICILKGKQGALKSTFWSVLAGEDNFTDDLSGTDKDEILKLSQYAMIEFSEFETAYRKKEVSALKAFLSRKSDSIRVPYGRDIQDIPRPSIFVGTTNKPEFLHDPTGERRYWAVPVECERIDISQLKIDRDAIWSAAKAAYLDGEQWWLTSEEDEMLNTSNSDFASTDVWEDAISGYVHLLREVSVREILAECLKIDLANHDRASQMRVSEILTRLGWVKCKKKKIDGRTVQCWNKPSQKCNLGVATKVVTEVATTSKTDTAMNTDNEVATVATFSQKNNFEDSKKIIAREKFNSTQQSFEKGSSNPTVEKAQMQSESTSKGVATSEVATSSNLETEPQQGDLLASINYTPQQSESVGDYGRVKYDSAWDDEDYLKPADD